MAPSLSVVLLMVLRQWFYGAPALLAESVVRLLSRDEWLPQCSTFCGFSMHMRHAGEPNSLVYT